MYILTDFICAFPTETEEDFEESMSLVKKYKFPSLFINQVTIYLVREFKRIIYVYF